MKLIGKVILVFALWVALAATLRALQPEVYESLGSGTWTSRHDSDQVAELQRRYSMIVSNLTAIGLRNEGETVAAEKRETRFTGTYGNVSDLKINVSLGKRPSADSTLLWISAKCVHPRWKNGGGSDYRHLKTKLGSMIKE